MGLGDPPKSGKKCVNYLLLGVLAAILVGAVIALSLWSADVFSEDGDDEGEKIGGAPASPQNQLDAVLRYIQQPDLQQQLQGKDDEKADQLLSILSYEKSAAAIQDIEDMEVGQEVNLLELFPVPVNDKYDSVVTDYDRPISSEQVVTTYNNYYEFGTTKAISSVAMRNTDYLDWENWEIEFTGLVAGGPRVLTLGQILANVTVEQRLYRHRCVEAWSIAVPWAGFPFSQLLEIVQPLPDARYVKMQTKDFDKGGWSEWLKSQKFPYTEAIAMFEARNDLAFLVVGAYQKPLLPQNGAPIRLALPWKYGFKSVKSIAKIEYTYERPVNFWQSSNAREYGFWANVNPNISHPRWSQATERLFIDDVATAKRVPSLYFNGYQEYVQDMYTDLPEKDQEILYMK